MFRRDTFSVLRESIQVAIRINSSAFGFSIVIGAALAAAVGQHGGPNELELLLFGLGGVAAFSVIDLIASGGFDRSFTSKRPEIVAHAASLSFFSVGISIGTAIGIAHLVPGTAAWPATSFITAATFVLMAGFELAAAETVAEENGSD